MWENLIFSVNPGLHKRQVSTLEHLGIPQTAFVDTVSEAIESPYKNQPDAWKKKKKALYILHGLKEVYHLGKRIKLFGGQVVNPFAWRTLLHQDRLWQCCWISSLRSKHITLYKVPRFGCLGFWKFCLWRNEQCQILCSTFWTPSLTLWILFFWFPNPECCMQNTYGMEIRKILSVWVFTPFKAYALFGESSSSIPVLLFF